MQVVISEDDPRLLREPAYEVLEGSLASLFGDCNQARQASGSEPGFGRKLRELVQKGGHTGQERPRGGRRHGRVATIFLLEIFHKLLQ